MIKLPAALFDDGRVARVVNRLVSRVMRTSPLRDVFARRVQQRLPAGARRALFVCKGNICRSAYAHAVAGRVARPETGWMLLLRGPRCDTRDGIPGDGRPRGACPWDRSVRAIARG